MTTCERASCSSRCGPCWSAAALAAVIHDAGLRFEARLGVLRRVADGNPDLAGALVGLLRDEVAGLDECRRPEALAKIALTAGRIDVEAGRACVEASLAAL